MEKLLTHCPVCQHPLKVTKLECAGCNTKVEGEFAPAGLGRLNPDQEHFIGVFLEARGNIKEVEKVLQISYPTVRKKLEEISRAFTTSLKEKEKRKKQILNSIESGKIDAQQAAKLLRSL